MSGEGEAKPALDGPTCGQLSIRKQADDGGKQATKISANHMFMQEIVKNISFSELIISSSCNTLGNSVSIYPRRTATNLFLSHFSSVTG